MLVMFAVRPDRAVRMLWRKQETDNQEQNNKIDVIQIPFVTVMDFKL